MQVSTALIHEFSTAAMMTDDDGEPMLGFYWQFANGEDEAITGLIGPYTKRMDAEKAAQRAFDQKDY